MNDDNFLPQDLEDKIAKALAKKSEENTKTLNQKEWNEIMEDANKRNTFSQSKTKWIAVAASAALIVAVSATALVANSGNSTKDVITVDDKEAAEVVSTTPLTREESLLKDGFLVKRIILGARPSTDAQDSRLTLVRAIDGSEVEKFTVEIGKANLELPMITNYSGNVISITSGFSPSCDSVTYFNYNVETNESFITSGVNGIGERIYSPSGKKYAEVDLGCSWENPQWTGGTLTITDVKSGTKRVIKPEAFAYGDSALDQPNQTISVTNFKWINDNQVMLGTAINTANGLNWKLASLDKPISLNNARDLTAEGVAPTSSDGTVDVMDVIQVDGKIYTLVGSAGTRNLIVSVIDTETKSEVWTKDLGPVNPGSGDGVYPSALKFAGSINVITGDVYLNATMYDQSIDKIFTYDAVALYIKK